MTAVREFRVLVEFRLQSTNAQDDVTAATIAVRQKIGMSQVNGVYLTGSAAMVIPYGMDGMRIVKAWEKESTATEETK